MNEDHKIAAPELDAPSLGQELPPERKVHHLVADDLVIDLYQLFNKVDELMKMPTASQPPPFLRPPPDKE